MTLQQQQILLQNYLKKARLSLSRKPEGSLTISNSHNRNQYFLRLSPQEKKGKYIPKKNEKLILALAQKDYDLKFIKAAEALFKKNESLQKLGGEVDVHYIYRVLSKVYSDLSPSRRELVTPYILPDDLFALAWKQVEYQGKEFTDDSPFFTTENGEKVRSKSEKMIADKLLRMEIPYRYEYPYKFKNLGIVHIDFTLLNVRNRREFIFEHFGRLEDPVCRERMVKKMHDYTEAGYLPGVNFLFTTETLSNPLDITCFEKMIRHFFPYAAS